MEKNPEDLELPEIAHPVMLPSRFLDLTGMKCACFSRRLGLLEMP